MIAYLVHTQSITGNKTKTTNRHYNTPQYISIMAFSTLKKIQFKHYTRNLLKYVCFMYIMLFYRIIKVNQINDLECICIYVGIKANRVEYRHHILERAKINKYCFNKSDIF